MLKMIEIQVPKCMLVLRYWRRTEYVGPNLVFCSSSAPQTAEPANCRCDRQIDISSSSGPSIIVFNTFKLSSIFTLIEIIQNPYMIISVKMDFPSLPRTKGSFIRSIIWIILIIDKLQVLDSIFSWVFIVIFFEIWYIPE